MNKIDDKRITIIVLLILAAVSIATLTGENGILTQAGKAKEETTKAEALEKVQIAVLGSYGEDGNLDNDTLKTNLNNVDGISGTAQNISFPFLFVQNKLCLTFIYCLKYINSKNCIE